MFGYETRDGISMEDSFHGRVSFFEREARLAKNFVLKSVKPEPVENALCPVCGTRVKDVFFEKWSLLYYLCGECWTIFAPSLAEEVKEFEKQSPLAALRCSEEYQQNANAGRTVAWQSLVNWIRHRIFRYLDVPDGCTALVRGIRYRGLLHLLRQQPVFRRLDIKGSILMPDTFGQEEYDIAFYLDTLQRRTAPMSYLERAYGFLRSGGLLFVTTRVGTGFDLLTLKGRADTLFPYEHIFLPSVNGLCLLLERAGFSVLETSTPGMFDVAHVYKQRDALEEGGLFARFLTSQYEEGLFSDFQKFLQKHGLSSTVRIVAKKP